MTISNPKPSEISSGTWSVEGGINRFTVNISTEPADNDLAGIIVIAKSGSAPSYPDDVFYKGPWQEFIVVDTDASNNALLPNTSYTVGVAAYDQFGSDASDVDFGSTTKDVTTVQVVTADIANSAVDTAQVNDDAITDAKIDSLTATKITAGTLTGATIQTASTGKRFVVSTSDNEAHFYGDRGDATVEELASMGIKSVGGDTTVLDIGSTNLDYVAAILWSSNANYTAYVRNDGNGDALYAVNTNGGKGVYAQSDSITGGGYGVHAVGNRYGVYGRTADPAGNAGYFRSSGGTVINPSSKATVEIINDHDNSRGSALKIDVTGSGSSSTKAIDVANGTSNLSGGVVYFKSYTVATLPSAGTAGGMIYVSDETGGAVMAFSDGTDWRRVTDRSVVA